MSEKEKIDVIDFQNENRILVQKLTKRNAQYIYDFENSMKNVTLKGKTVEQLKYEMMLQMIEAQKKGITAKQLFGTVTSYAKVVSEGPKEDLSKPSPNWQLYIDGALLMGSVFMLLSGITNSQQLGIVTLILNYFIVGLAMLVMSKAAVEYKNTMKNTTNRWKPTLRYMLLSAGSMIVWFLGLTLAILIPTSLNPLLSREIYLVIGAMTFALRFYLKKQLHIRGGIF